jgi:hypothetical protein
MNKTQQYFDSFKMNLIKVGEPTSEYLIRISKALIKKGVTVSPRTLEKWYSEFNRTENELKRFEIKKENTLLKLPATKLENNIVGMHIVLPDVHVPYENYKVLNGISALISDYKDQIKGFHLIGDYLNMEALSRHNQDEVPNAGYSLGLEYERGNAWLDILTDDLKDSVRKTYLWGNHEDNWNRYFKNINTSVFKDALMSPTKALKLVERGFEVYEDWKEDSVWLGKLQLIHGLYLNQNAIKTHMNKCRSSVMYGHSHRMGTVYEGDHAGFNIGWLGDVNAPGFKYASRLERASWVNGFAMVYVNEDGTYQVNVINCQNNEFWFGGKKY